MIEILKKRKIVVYAITKNEEKYVRRWYESMKEADAIYVLDTGSTDNTVNLLRDLGVKVYEDKIEPWRFDVARNKSLELVPLDTDICVCTDLDEVLCQGWRSELEKIWQDMTTRCQYVYNWQLDKFDRPVVSFYYEKIHARKNFKWIYPVHEVLEYSGIENYVRTDNIVLNHYQDTTKSRSFYLPLLELSVKENPENDRNMHYLGREYMYYGKWNEAIDTLEKHLNLKTATWKDERCASMRFIARCYDHLGRYEEAKMWYDLAIKEAPYLRDGYMEKALLMYKLENYGEVEKLVKKALKIKKNYKTYINENFTFNETPYDLLSIVYYEKKDYKKSLYYVKKALKMAPQDTRIKNNYDIIKKEVENSNESKGRSIK